MDKNLYIVLLDEGFLRDIQAFDPEGMSDEELNTVMDDLWREDLERRWYDTQGSLYVGFAWADSDKEAVKTVAANGHYDPRVLYAEIIPVPEGARQKN